MIHIPKELRVGRGKFTPNAELAFALDLDYKKLLLNLHYFGRGNSES